MKKSCVTCSNILQGNQQKYCSNACKQKAHWYSFKLQPNTYHSQTKRALSRKLKYIEYLGGKCSSCGYCKNIAALEFNHLDTSKKSFNIDSRKLSNTNESVLLNEVEKCNLLCSNCHREYHNPELELVKVKKMDL